MRHHYTDLNGTTHEWETPDTPAPLDPVGALAALLAVLGLASVDDAANAAGVTPQDLVNEAIAWGVGRDSTDPF